MKRFVLNFVENGVSTLGTGGGTQQPGVNVKYLYDRYCHLRNDQN